MGEEGLGARLDPTQSKLWFRGGGVFTDDFLAAVIFTS